MLLDYVAAARIELEEVAELVEGAAEVCRAAGVALDRRRDRRAAGHLPRGRARLRRHVRRHRRPRRADRRLGDRGRRRRDRLPVRRRPRERVHARPPRARGGGLRRAPTCSRRRGSTSTSRARLRGRARAFAHVTGGGILGNLERVLPAGRTAELDWDAWERPPVFALARAPRRGGGAAPRVQPRHRLVRGRAPKPSRASS